MNYTSGYKKTSFLGIPSVRKISKTINPLVNGFFKLSENARYGIIIMDYISKSSTFLIVNLNFYKAKVDGVILFEDIFLRGNSTLPITAGKHSYLELQSFGFNSSFTSSIILPENWEVKMYEEDFFKGKCWTLSKNDEVSCNFSNFGFDTPNNKVLSMIITKSQNNDFISSEELSLEDGN